MKTLNSKILNAMLLLIIIACLIECKKKEPKIPTTLTDIDGNSYNVIIIGTLVWMKENLKTTRFNDGKAITNVTDNAAWKALTTPGYCWYNNDEATYKASYGAIYNWYAVNTDKLCPTGWHLPTDAEWSTLTTYFGGEVVAGGKLKETDTPHWKTPNIGATNSSDFTALPGGYRGNSSNNGTFFYIGVYGCWWSSTEYDTYGAWYRLMSSTSSSVNRIADLKGSGFSARCVWN